METNNYNKSIEYKKSTKAGIIVAIVLSLGIAVLNTMGMIKNYSKLSTSVIVYGIFFAIFMLLSCAGLIFLLNKRKSGKIFGS